MSEGPKQTWLKQYVGEDWRVGPSVKFRRIAWLDQHGIQPVARDRFEEFLKQSPAAAKVQSDAEREALFKQFQAWEAEKNARAQAQVRPTQKER